VVKERHYREILKKRKSITADAADICMCIPQSRVVNIHVQVVVIDVHCQLKALKISEQIRN
jgi:hypothetical protein